MRIWVSDRLLDCQSRCQSLILGIRSKLKKLKEEDRLFDIAFATFIAFAAWMIFIIILCGLLFIPAPIFLKILLGIPMLIILPGILGIISYEVFSDK